MTEINALSIVYATLAAYVVFALVITVRAMRKAAKAGPVDYTADRPTLRPGCMARFGEVEKTCCHGHAK